MSIIINNIGKKNQLFIDHKKCIWCELCIKVCPSKIFAKTENGSLFLEKQETCISCGHCISVCKTEAIEHYRFPKEKKHRIDYSKYPSPDQLMLLIKARRSNRVFSDIAVPTDYLEKIVEAGNCAPTARNKKEVGFVIINDDEKIRFISKFTFNSFDKILKKAENPILKPVLKRLYPDLYSDLPRFKEMQSLYLSGNDYILRNAKSVILFHTPKNHRFGCEDANLAYQNASLMAECLGVAHFYTGFVITAIKRDKQRKVQKMLGINGDIQAGMALGMPAFRYEFFVERK